MILSICEKTDQDLLGGPVIENPPASAGVTGLIPGREIKVLHAIWRGPPPPQKNTMLRWNKRKEYK